MDVFPDIATIPYGPTLTRSIEFKTLRQQFESGTITRKKKRVYPLRQYQLKYPGLGDSDIETLYQFYIEHYGGYSEFIIFDKSDTLSYVKEYVATGDGVTTVFNLPSLSATSYTLYIDNVAKTAGGVDWTFAEAGGDSGEDSCTLVAAAGAGERITFSFTGRLRVRAVFADDRMSYDEFYTDIVTVGISIFGLLTV